MIAVKEKHDAYLSNFVEIETELAAGSPPWLSQIRRDAIRHYAELGFPTTRMEEWKYTNVAPITKVAFQPVREAWSARALDEAALRSRRLDCPELVFVNGCYSPDLSSVAELPARVKAGSLAAALASGVPALQQHLAQYAGYENHAFIALNTAFVADGIFVEIPKDEVIGKPIHVIYVSTLNNQPTLTHPRNLILVGRGAQVSLVETYVGLESPSASWDRGAVYFTNSVTEVAVGEGAVVDYCKIQEESEQSFHVATLKFHQARSSSVTTHTLAFGGALDREEITTVLDGEGAESLLHGLYVIGGRQHVDNHTAIDHAKPHCSSRELYKGILDGQSTGVFNGKIIVRPDAQKTDSKQSNKNLLLSGDAVINTKPQLEIYADDVKCTHGATIGQIDQEAVFYLRSRGIGLKEARAMLTRAFANDVIEKIKFEPLRAWLKDELLTKLALEKKSAVRNRESGETRGRVSRLEDDFSTDVDSEEHRP